MPIAPAKRTKKKKTKTRITKATKAPRVSKTKTKTRKKLSKSWIETLKVLKKANTKHGSKELTRVQLADKTGIKDNWSQRLGCVTKGKPAKGTMEGEGLIISSRHEGQKALTYAITAKGRTELEKALKSAK